MSREIEENEVDPAIADQEIGDEQDVEVEKPKSDMAAAFEKRFSEMSAKFDVLQTENQTLKEVNQQLISRERGGAAPARRVVDDDLQIPEELDPQIAGMLKRMDMRNKHLEARLNGIQYAQSAASDIASVAAREGIDDPEVLRLSAERLADWRSRGMDFDPVNALDFGIGQVERFRKKNPGHVPKTTGAPRSNGGSRPPPPARSQQRQSLPDNFESLPADQQRKVLKSSGLPEDGDMDIF